MLGIRDQWIGVGALMPAGLLWGSSFIWGKFALAESSFVDVTLLRFLLASVVFAPLAWRRPVRCRDVPALFLVGVLMVPVTFLVQFAGLAQTSASTAALIIGSLPVLVAIGSWLTGERLGKRKTVAVGASTVGVALCVGRAQGSQLTGSLLVLASMLAVVGWVLLGKRVLDRYEPVQAAAWTIILGTMALIPVALVAGGLPDLTLSTRGWISVVVLGIACSTLSTIMWNIGLSKMETSGAGIFLNVEPLTGAALGVIVLHERLSTGLVAGGLLIIGSATYVALASSEPKAKSSPKAWTGSARKIQSQRWG